MGSKMELEERIEVFYSRTVRRGECLIWTAGRINTGYGSMRFPEWDEYLTHRVAYIIGSGELIPDGLHVLHKCDVRPCVEYTHLELGTNEDNIRHRLERNPQRKYPDVIAERIRVDREKGMTLFDLELKYDVSAWYVDKAIKGER